MELCADLGVAVGVDDAWGEEGVAVGWDDEAEVHEPAQEDLEVFEDVEDVRECDGAFGRGSALVLFEASFDVGAFVFGEPRLLYLLVGLNWKVDRGKRGG